MSLRYLLSIDLGTTAEKCVVYDETGKVWAEAQQEIKTIYPKPGQAEIPAMQFYKLTCENIKKCLHSSKINPKNIAGIAVDSLMGGIIGIDKNYNPVTYYDTCMDTRDAYESDYILKNFGELVLEKNGSYSVWGHKLLYWKKRNEWDEISKFIQPSAFVAGKLAGITAKKSFIDPSFLSFSALSNLSTSEWSDELIEVLKIDMGKLPKIVNATDIIGVTTKKTAELTGLAEGIPICAGCGDVTAGFIGAGIIKPGQMVDISGTANILGISVSEFKYDRNVACMKSPVQNSYYLMSNVMGGRTLKWFAEEFFSEKKEELLKTGSDIYSYLDEKAESIPPGSNGLVALIDLQGRFFPPDPSMRGLFVGHTWSHTRLHFYRSILEAVAYDHYLTRRIVKTLFPELDLNSAVSIGSGAKSKMWLRIKADVLQMPLSRLGRSDLSTLGAAIIAGLSVGIFKNIEEVSERFLNIKEVIEPVKNADKKYAKYVEAYIRSLDLMQEIYRKIFYQ